ncbi:MAG: hypothetical protein CMJ40_04815 [Phycisphaerae bacterium]|mgnify:CR=1 FL=1|nr:hypothetical protein [Phycisphaerae bacterium]
MKRTRRRRTGFSVPELMIALLISAMLLLATMIALGASFHAFQSTTRTVSTTVSGRIIIERIQAMVRSGTDFGPLPASPLDSVVASNAIEIDMGDNHWITLRWDESTAALMWEDGPDSWPLLEGVTQIPPGADSPVPPFTLEFKDGRWLHRAFIDLVVEHDDAQDIQVEADEISPLRLIGSAMPRLAAWD